MNLKGSIAANADLTLHECRVESPLPARQSAAGLRPAAVGRAQGFLQLPLLSAVAQQEVTAAQVDGDHQTLVAVERPLHVLGKRNEDERKVTRTHIKDDDLHFTNKCIFRFILLFFYLSCLIHVPNCL